LVHTFRILDSQTGSFHSTFIANQELQTLIFEWKGNLQHKTSFKILLHYGLDDKRF